MNERHSGEGIQASPDEVETVTIPSPEDRTTITFWASKSVAKMFRSHARATGMSVGAALERAMAEWVATHPATGRMVLQQEIVETVKDRREELKAQILGKKIRKTMKIIDNIRRAGDTSGSAEYEGRLLDLLLRAGDVKGGGDEFVELLEEAYRKIE